MFLLFMFSYMFIFSTNFVKDFQHGWKEDIQSMSKFT